VNRLGTTVTILATSTLFLASAAPARDVVAQSPARFIKVESDAYYSLMTITGTPSADRLLIDRESANGPYEITANRPIRVIGDCEKITSQVASCSRLEDERLLGVINVGLEGGADRARLAARSYAAIPVILGDSGDDRLLGGTGDDFLDGGAGDDLLRGHDGGDRLEGDHGDDAINGGVGPDVLIGGEGRDQCVGGSGEDHRRRDC